MPVLAKPTLLQAAKALYDSIGGGLPTLWLDEVPEGGTPAGYPRGILRDRGQRAGDDVNEDTGTVPVVHHDFEIELLVENDSDTAETLALLVLATFAPTAIRLTFDANAVLDHTRRTWITRGTGERSPADKPIYSSLMNFSCQYGTNY